MDDTTNSMLEAILELEADEEGAVCLKMQHIRCCDRCGTSIQSPPFSFGLFSLSLVPSSMSRRSQNNKSLSDENARLAQQNEAYKGELHSPIHISTTNRPSPLFYLSDSGDGKGPQ